MKYIVKLKPIEPFFFGGDKNFGASYGKQEANFYVRSQRLPQQTQLLGMLKKVILQQNGFLQFHPFKKEDGLHFGEWVKDFKKRPNGKYKKAKELVGVGKLTSDDLTDKNLTFEHGKIEKISPIFFTKDELYYNYKPIIDGVELKLYDTNAKTSINGVVIDKAFKLKKRDKEDWIQKDGLTTSFVGVDVDGKIVEIYNKDIFEDIVSLGNRKNSFDTHRYKKKDKEDKEEGFYKKVTYRLKDDFSFAFIVDFKGEISLKNDIVHLGGEGSRFLMELSPIDENTCYEKLFEHIYLKKDYITFASECYVPDKVMDSEDIQFMASQGTKSFRSVQTQKDRKFTRETTTIYLLQRGTMIKIDKDKQGDFLKQLKIKNLQNIGYNIIIHEEKS